MPKKFQVTAPDGHVLEITGPDDATEEQAIAQAQQLYKPQESAAPAATPPQRSAESYLDPADPHYQAKSTLLEGAKRAYDAAQGVKDAVVSTVAHPIDAATSTLGFLKDAWLNPSKAAQSPMLSPVTTSARGIGAIAGVNKPPTEQEFQEAAHSAGGNMGGIMVGEAINAGIGAATPTRLQSLATRARAIRNGAPSASDVVNSFELTKPLTAAKTVAKTAHGAAGVAATVAEPVLSKLAEIRNGGKPVPGGKVYTNPENYNLNPPTGAATADLAQATDIGMPVREHPMSSVPQPAPQPLPIEPASRMDPRYMNTPPAYAPEGEALQLGSQEPLNIQRPQAAALEPASRMDPRYMNTPPAYAPENTPRVEDTTAGVDTGGMRQSIEAKRVADLQEIQARAQMESQAAIPPDIQTIADNLTVGGKGAAGANLAITNAQYLQKIIPGIERLDPVPNSTGIAPFDRAINDTLESTGHEIGSKLDSVATKTVSVKEAVAKLRKLAMDANAAADSTTATKLNKLADSFGDEPVATGKKINAMRQELNQSSLKISDGGLGKSAYEVFKKLTEDLDPELAKLNHDYFTLKTSAELANMRLGGVTPESQLGAGTRPKARYAESEQVKKLKELRKK